ncbi:MAG: type I DNA topoisomerase, partial [Thermodesulfobacteriota bacterium]|nr:type I DNA topoisomerase [Thermodesulfobacteriota bacterium]
MKKDTGKNLVLVESPAKSNTIGKILGSNFIVLSSKGHVRALPSKTGSVDVDKGFKPHYQILPQSRKYLKKIKEALEGCNTLYLATDIDREGEAIAWHLIEALGLNKDRKSIHLPVIQRITFHEITKEAISKALKNPREVSMNLVNAQQTRVILDYLFGFNLSPFLWKKVRTGLSAGRVQSVALRLVCEREKEINSFSPKEYWRIFCEFKTENNSTFWAELTGVKGKRLQKSGIKDRETAEKFVRELKNKTFKVKDYSEKELMRNPNPPFITSTLQQEAFKNFGFTAEYTMSLAQKLYEGTKIGNEDVGLITYMRTDSFNIAAFALDDIKKVISEEYGSMYTLKSHRVFRKKVKNAQEAHEAIRPTKVSLRPEDIRKFLTKDMLKLYDLIWKRTVASQTSPAILNSVNIKIYGGDYILQAGGTRIKFPGFMKIYKDYRDESEEKEGAILPLLKPEQPLEFLNIDYKQHFTQPPPRYSEASLIKTLESLGIGRPSTYANIMGILKKRDYVTFINKKFHPQEIGMIVTDLLVQHFNKYVEYDFTAGLEEDLDNIANGEKEWKSLLNNYWEPFKNLIQEKETKLKRSDILDIQTDEVCPKCNGNLVIKFGKYGRFYACQNYPECKYVKSLNKDVNGKTTEETDQECEKCGGKLIIRESRFGSKFLGCSNYPKCNFTHSLDIVISCPMSNCQGSVIEKRTKKGRVFYGCNKYPKCQFAVWNRPVDRACPECKSSYMLE